MHCLWLQRLSQRLIVSLMRLILKPPGVNRSSSLADSRGNDSCVEGKKNFILRKCRLFASRFTSQTNKKVCGYSVIILLRTSHYFEIVNFSCIISFHVFFSNNISPCSWYFLTALQHVSEKFVNSAKQGEKGTLAYASQDSYTWKIL